MISVQMGTKLKPSIQGAGYVSPPLKKAQMRKGQSPQEVFETRVMCGPLSQGTIFITVSLHDSLTC